MKCRVCNSDFFEEALIRFENMPKSAQFLPDKDCLGTDKGINFGIYQCSGCGLVQISNDPVHYYREVIRATGVSKEMRDFRQEQFSDFIKRFSLNRKKIIEIGCGKGEYLSIMNQLGIDAYGLEYSAESVEQCRKNGLNVVQGFVDSSAYSLPNAPFDAFYTLNFLEHLPDPNSALRGIYNNLSYDAVGLVEVPNFDMILKKNLFSEFITDHLFYFTRETLNTVLILNGFEVIESNEICHNYIISTVVRKRKPLDITHFYNQQEKIKQELNEYINRFDKKVAVWGAGHQSFAILALADMADKIKYVIDSAEFKQGKYTPSTHIPIVAPHILDIDPVNAVIVIAGSYSDEVANIIRQRYDRNIDIAILRDYGLENY